MTRRPNWGDFARPSADTDATSKDDFTLLTMRLFDSPDGRRWLGIVGADKFGRPISATISDAELRFLEGQRQMLRDIDRLVAAGNETIKAKKQG